MKNYLLFILLIITFSVSSFFPQIIKHTIEPPAIPDVIGFGSSVGGYGEYAVVGAPQSHSNGIYAQGLAVVYKKSGLNWEEYQVLIPNDNIPENFFGWRVAMSDELLLVYSKSPGRKLYVYKLNSSNIWEEAGIINTLSEVTSIVISGNYFMQSCGNFAQCAIYYYDGNNLIRQLYLHDEIYSGWIDEDYAIVGHPQHNFNTGMALIFRRVGTVWQIQDTLFASDAHFDDRFGSSVSIDGDYAIVGAWGRENNKGGAYIFKKEGNDWIEQVILTDGQSDWTADAYPVLIKENYAVIASYWASLQGFTHSFLNIFKREADDWNLIYRAEEEIFYAYDIAMTFDFIISGFWDFAVGMYNEAFIYEGLNITSIEEINEPLTKYTLSNNFPNPFNPTTTIRFEIPEVSFVTLKVFDVLGNEISILINEEKPVGNYEVEWDASVYPSGIYFYRLQTGNYIETKKMIFLK